MNSEPRSPDFGSTSTPPDASPSDREGPRCDEDAREHHRSSALDTTRPGGGFDLRTTIVIAVGLLFAVIAGGSAWRGSREVAPPAADVTPSEVVATPELDPPPPSNSDASVDARRAVDPPRSEAEWRRELSSAARHFEASDLAAIRHWLETIMADARAGDGDLLLELLMAGSLSEAEVAATHALLRTLLSTTLQVTDPAPPEWFGSIEGVVVLLLDAVAEFEGSRDLKWGPFHDLLCIDGLVTRDHLRWVSAVLESSDSSSFRAILMRLIGAMPLESEDEVWIVPWMRHEDPDVRRVAYGALLRIDPDRVSHLTDRLVHGEPSERKTVFRGLCDHVLPEDLPFVLLELHDQRVDVDLTQGLPAYLERHGGASFDEIIYLHGRGQESDHYRSRAVASINHSLRGRSISADLARHLVNVCSTDPAPSVRGTALLGLALAWDSNDRDGFDRWIEGLGEDPDLAPFVEGARANFDASRELRNQGRAEPGTISHDRALSLRER